MTLFLGAGISHSRGVPLWDEVVRRMSEWVVGDDEDVALLARVRASVARDLGADVAERVVLRRHPLEPQLALEWIEAELTKPPVRREVAARLGMASVDFVTLLRRALYERVSRSGPASDALAAVGDAVRAEWERGPARHVARVITLNADDLLEREVCGDGVPRLWPIARPSRHPRWEDRERPPPIPVYHVHGYLPEDARDPRGSGHTLVFTDDQFWSTTASPLSFANRVVANALHDTQCVFAGLSMRDVNLMRWLAVRFEEVRADARAHGEAVADEALHRHFWIHVASDDPTGILSDILAKRGVRSVDLPSWRSSAFGDLLRDCFARSIRNALSVARGELGRLRAHVPRMPAWPRTGRLLGRRETAIREPAGRIVTSPAPSFSLDAIDPSR